MAYLICGLTQQELLAFRVAYGAFGLTALIKCVSAIGYDVLGDWRASAESWLDSFPDFLMFVVLSVNQRYSIAALAAYGLLDIVVEVLTFTQQKESDFLINMRRFYCRLKYISLIQARRMSCLSLRLSVQ